MREIQNCEKIRLRCDYRVHKSDVLLIMIKTTTNMTAEIEYLTIRSQPTGISNRDINPLSPGTEVTDMRTR